ncbi:MAG: amino acid permease [Candidatus Ancillula sp.]|jgi:APA family basic amino acid/polyamine antiporter|nr:amino acid permease [Candidatus Ancillula sp.]
MNLLRKHSKEYTFKHLEGDEQRQLKRSLHWWDITIMAIAICVGAGIFSVGAKVITQYAGPASIISFIIAGVICGLAAMCYAEFTSVIPVAGSAYTYSYSALGEIVAWIIGWDLILEFFLSTAVILKYWCVYLYSTLRLLGMQGAGGWVIGGRTFDWPIFVAALFIILVLVKGASFSSKTAGFFVALKLAIILIIIVMGIQYFNPANFTPFIPPASTSGVNAGDTMRQSLFSFMLGQQPQVYGIFGIFTGAGIIFFAFLGFDGAASVAEETVNPRKNVPIGLMAGVGVVTVIYIAIAVITVGMVKYTDFNAYLAAHPGETASLTTAFEIRGANNVGGIIALGILIGLTSVIMMTLQSLTRIVFAMSRDGLLPRWFSITSKKEKVPHRIIIVAGILVALVAAFAYVDVLDEMINIGTLSAFILVSFAVPIFRRLRKKRGEDIDTVVRMDGERVKIFKVPLSPFLPILSGIICIWLTLQLAVITWVCFVVWLIVGLAIYFGFGYKHSELEIHPEFIENDLDKVLLD